jgi:HEAT repeat protein
MPAPLAVVPRPHVKSTPVTSRPPAPAVRVTPVPPPTETPGQLAAVYFSSAATLEQREKIIHDLGEIATPAAGEVLGRIFQVEKRQDLKLSAFEAALDLPDETCREQKFAILQRGVSPAMAQIVRIGALQALAQFDDPRVTPALRTLTRDHDADMRQQAIEMLQERTENPR